MGASAAPLLVPSQLPEGVEAWVRDFATKLVDEVARPLFSASSVKELKRRLPDLLTRGAILRFRWLNALSSMPEEQAANLVNEWMRPPSPGVLEDLEHRAALLLGEERSFKVRRSLALMFVDCPEGTEGLIERWSDPSHGSKWFVEAAWLLETAARHDILALAWIAVLMGDIVPPRPEVAEAAATALLRETAKRASGLRALVDDKLPPRKLALETRRLPPAWQQAHRGLMLPALMVVGLALVDPDVRHVALVAAPDPEDEDLSLLEIRVAVRGAPDKVRERLEGRALRTGVSGSFTDGSAAIGITVAQRGA